MKTERFRSTPRQGLLIVLAVLLALVVLFRYGSTLWQGQEDSLSQSMDLKMQQYEALHQVVANSKDYIQLNASLRQKREDIIKTHFITGGTEALSKAAFQNIITKQAENSGLGIRTTRMLESVDQSGFTLLRMNVNARAEIAEIKDFLVGLQTDPHFLFQPQLEIKQISSRDDRFYYFNSEITGMAR